MSAVDALRALGAGFLAGIRNLGRFTLFSLRLLAAAGSASPAVTVSRVSLPPWRAP